MSKHAKKSDHLQLADASTTFVEVPLPMLGAFASIEDAFFDLCVHSSRQVLDATMEQDRECENDLEGSLGGERCRGRKTATRKSGLIA